MDLLRILPVQYRFSRSRSQGPIRNPRLIVADSVLVPYALDMLREIPQ